MAIQKSICQDHNNVVYTFRVTDLIMFLFVYLKFHFWIINLLAFANDACLFWFSFIMIMDMYQDDTSSESVHHFNQLKYADEINKIIITLQKL